MRIAFIVPIIFGSIFTSAIAIAEDTPRSAYELGEAAMDESNYVEAVGHFRQAIDQTPDDYRAHDAFLNAARTNAIFSTDPELDEAARGKAIKAAREASNADLTSIYDEWAASDPGNAIYQWALGTLKMGSMDYDKAEEFMLEAMRLDPGFASPYETLALLEDVRGNPEGQKEYLRRAVEADPANPDVAFSYAMLFRKGDIAALEKNARNVADRFPEHDRGAQALYWLAIETEDLDKKVRLFKELNSRYPIEDFSWSVSGLSSLFAIYAKTDPERALEVAETMVDLNADDDGQFSMSERWTRLRDFQKNVNEANRLVEAGDHVAARDLLAENKIPRGASDDPYNAAMARAIAGADSAQAAYDFLTGIVADKPTDLTNQLLAEYAADLSVSPEQVRADVAAKYEANAKPLEDFSFERIDTDETISLSDYHGKVVLMNFWYPFCGPCRGENPTIQKILAKYQDRGFEVLALNIKPEEEHFVMPYISGNDFGFIPLRSTHEWAVEHFQARGYPTNILIDTQGRMISRLPPIHGDAARTFELQIEALLSKGDAS